MIKKTTPLILLIFLTLIPLSTLNSVQYSDPKTPYSGNTNYPVMVLNNGKDHSIINLDYGDFLNPRKASYDFKIVIDEGHGQRYAGDALKTFKDIISKFFGTIIINEDNITESDLQDTDLLIIPNTEGRNLTTSEIELIQNYVENGGKLFIMGDYYGRFDPTYYNILTSKYGIKWRDASARDETDNYGYTFLVKVHTWDVNIITSNIGVPEYASEVLHSGTVLELTNPDNTVVSSGPYFLGVPDGDAYFRENGSDYVLGVNWTEPFGYHVAVELTSGGRIIATGSSTTFSDNYNNINYGDDEKFARLTLAWLLGVPPEDVLIPEIKNVEFTETFRPLQKGTLNFTIENIISKDLQDIKVKIMIPYFLEVSGQITITRSTGTTYENYVPGAPLELGTLQGLEQVVVSVPLKCVIGNEKTGGFSIELYQGSTLLAQYINTTTSLPTFKLEAAFSPFFINISKVNYSELIVNITNLANYDIENVTIKLENIPEGVKANVTEITIPFIQVNQSKIVTIKVEVPGLGVYETPVTVTDPYGSTAVRRPFILAITQKLLIFDEGHNQYVRFSSTYMQGLIDLMSEYGPVLINKGEFPVAVLDATVTSVIVIPVPQPDTASPSDTSSPIFTDNEIKGLQSYVDDGGSLLLMGNWYTYFWPDNPNSYNELTEPYGIHWIDGDLYDLNNSFGASYQVILRNFADNPVAKFLSSGVEEVYFVGTGVQLVQPTKPATVYPILLGNNESFITTGAIDAPRLFEGKNCTLIIASETVTGGRIIASGSSYMFSDYYQFAQNTEFIRNIISWLAKISKLTVEVSPIPAKINIGETVPIKVRVKNSGVQTIKNVKIELSFPIGLKTQNTSAIKEIGDLEPGEYVDVTWVVSSEKEATYLVELTVTSDNYPSQSVSIILNYTKQQPTIGIGVYLSVGIIILIIVVSLIIWRKQVFKRSL